MFTFQQNHKDVKLYNARNISNFFQNKTNNLIQQSLHAVPIEPGERVCLEVDG